VLIDDRHTFIVDRDDERVSELAQGDHGLDQRFPRFQRFSRFQRFAAIDVGSVRL